MLCPKCGGKMKPGGLHSARGSAPLYWASREFLAMNDENAYSTTAQRMEKAGCIPLYPHGRGKNATPAWACEMCKLVLLETGEE